MQLKQFQIEGAVFCAGRERALLADEPGVGKTPQLCTAAKLVRSALDRTLTGLVVCPSIAIEHWRRELGKWGIVRPEFDFRVISWDDAHKLRDRLAPSKNDIARTVDPWPGTYPYRWDILILDECHFGKNPYARRTQAVFAEGGLGYYARRIWCASGTPSPNNASELWPVLQAFGAVNMDHDAFTRYFCVVDDQGKVRGNRQDHIDELRAILKSCSLRRLKKNVLPELGAIDIQEWYVDTNADFCLDLWNPDGPEIRSVIGQEDRLRRSLATKSSEELLAWLAGDQEFATLRRYNALLKAPAVFETVKFELEQGLLDKVVIFAYHREAMAALHGAFTRAGIDSTLIYGDTPRAERDALVERWKRQGQVNISSTIIAATALDYTAAHQGIALEMDWVPGNNSQAFQRMHRFGQENPVTVRVAMGTPIDEMVNGVLVGKVRDLAEVWDS